jgi:hypothetical protein
MRLLAFVLVVFLTVVTAAALASEDSDDERHPLTGS